VAPPLAAPRALTAPAAWPAGESLAAWALLPAVDWAAGLREAWRPGEAGAQVAWRAFAGERLAAYDQRRDLPATAGTSGLSPHLARGEVSPRRLWYDARAAGPSEPWRRQLAWREFGHHLLHHFPHTRTDPLDPRFGAFPWSDDAGALQAWQAGRTGYPLVDAGMRQLWTTGWMHNRVRMVVASFLVKHLLQPWQAGAAWFADTLVDHDPANNTMGWQWTAGCGADAAPFFRIFNPVAQGRRYDPDGAYVARWVPELAGLPARRRHAPWEATPAELAGAGVDPGVTYPVPMVDHASARARALEAWAMIRETPRSRGKDTS
jgi:deoxyribodipyrimidine photo-lyase